MNLKEIISERSQREDYMLYDSIYRKGKSIQTESGLMVVCSRINNKKAWGILLEDKNFLNWTMAMVATHSKFITKSH